MASPFGDDPVAASPFGDEPVAGNAAPQSPAALQSAFWQAQAKGDTAGMKSAFTAMQAQGVHLASPADGSIPLHGASDNPNLQMQTSDNIGAGIGQALHSTGQGIGQLLGLSTAADADQSKRIDASLLATPAGKLGQIGGTVGQFAAPIGDAAGALGVVGKAAPYVNAAVKGGLFGFAQPVGTGDSRAVNTGVNAALNVGGQAVAGGLGALATKAAPVVDSVKQQGIDLLRAMGVQPSLAQVSDSPFLKYLSSMAGKLPFSGAAAAQAQRAAGFTQAASTLVGENTPKLGQDVMDSVKARLGAAYDSLFARNQVALAAPVKAQLDALATQASKDLTPDEAKIVTNQIAKYTDAAEANGGQIPGPLYQSIRAQLQKLQSPDAKGALIGDVRKTMESAANDSFKGNDAAVLKDTNQQYANMKVLQKSLAGPQGALDEVSPGSLWSKVNGKYGATQGMRDLAQAGKNVLTEPPSSGTAERLLAAHALNPLSWPILAPMGIAGATVGRALNSPLAAQLLPTAARDSLNGLARLVARPGVLPAVYAAQK